MNWKMLVVLYSTVFSVFFASPRASFAVPANTPVDVPPEPGTKKPPQPLPPDPANIKPKPDADVPTEVERSPKPSRDRPEGLNPNPPPTFPPPGQERRPPLTPRPDLSKFSADIYTRSQNNSCGAIGELDRQKMSEAKIQIEQTFDLATKVEFLFREVYSEEADTLITLGRQFYRDANLAYKENRYFQAKETAIAADNLYQASKILLENELGYITGYSGAEDPNFSYQNAPKKAKSEIAQTESEINYYNSNEPSVTELLAFAQNLNESGSARSPSAPNYIDLARQQAAIYVARSARHLLASQHSPGVELP
jgi:hypothetical protein